MNKYSNRYLYSNWFFRISPQEIIAASSSWIIESCRRLMIALSHAERKTKLHSFESYVSSWTITALDGVRIVLPVTTFLIRSKDQFSIVNLASTSENFPPPPSPAFGYQSRRLTFFFFLFGGNCVWNSCHVTEPCTWSGCLTLRRIHISIVVTEEASRGGCLPVTRI